MKDDKSLSKLYRYEVLLQAIDFFAQKFNLEQLSYYAFETANNLLELNASALFISKDDLFRAEKTHNISMQGYSIPSQKNIREIATLHGDIIASHFDRFFETKDIDAFNMKIVIPLIIKDITYGFIVSDGKASEEFSEDDINIARALMRLVNNSLESSKIFSELQETNHQLDQKIFNLFSINQSSRALLSVLDLNKLYSLSIDIFSELTSSKVTSFGLYDEIRDRVIVRGYKNVFSSKKFYGEFELSNKEYKGYKIVFNYREDIKLLKEIFNNCEAFEALETEYVILLVRDTILGFVTISTPINERKYDQSLFELIESLASSTYISFRNAILFQEVSHQKGIIEQKLGVLTKLGLLIKNLNSCLDIDELSSLVIRTIHISFGIKKAFIALYDGDGFIIRDTVGFTPSAVKLRLNSNWDKLSSSGTHFNYTNDSNSTYLSEDMIVELGESNCLVISPILVDNVLQLDSTQPLGYIVVLQTQASLKEEEIFLIDTVANSIAPTINHMNSMQQLKQEYILDQRGAFIKNLSNKCKNRERYMIHFHVYYKKMPKKPFVDVDISIFEEYEHYYFDNVLFILSDEELDISIFDGEIKGSSVEDIVENIIRL